MSTSLADLPHTLTHLDALNRRLAGKEVAVFIADRPEDAVISDSGRATARDLAAQCSPAIFARCSRARP
jgi:hypothetical protein